MREVIAIMSDKELKRLGVMKKINATSMTVAEGAHMLSISLRQMKRIKKRYRKQGPMGLLHQRRGKLGNRRYESSLKNHVLTLLQCQYEGFGPILAAEKYNATRI